ARRLQDIESNSGRVDGWRSRMRTEFEWVEIIEPRTREHMYANLVTGECVWDPPADAKIKRTHDNQWWELFDPNTARFYYYNASSQRTVWHRPQHCDIIPLAKLQTLKQSTEAQGLHVAGPLLPKAAGLQEPQQKQQPPPGNLDAEGQPYLVGAPGQDHGKQQMQRPDGEERKCWLRADMLSALRSSMEANAGDTAEGERKPSAPCHDAGTPGQRALADALSRTQPPVASKPYSRPSPKAFPAPSIPRGKPSPLIPGSQCQMSVRPPGSLHPYEGTGSVPPHQPGTGTETRDFPIYDEPPAEPQLSVYDEPHADTAHGDTAQQSRGHHAGTPPQPGPNERPRPALHTFSSQGSLPSPSIQYLRQAIQMSQNGHGKLASQGASQEAVHVRCSSQDGDGRPGAKEAGYGRGNAQDAHGSQGSQCSSTRQSSQETSSRQSSQDCHSRQSSEMSMDESFSSHSTEDSVSSLSHSPGRRRKKSKPVAVPIVCPPPPLSPGLGLCFPPPGGRGPQELVSSLSNPSLPAARLSALIRQHQLGYKHSDSELSRGSSEASLPCTRKFLQAEEGGGDLGWGLREHLGYESDGALPSPLAGPVVRALSEDEALTQADCSVRRGRRTAADKPGCSAQLEKTMSLQANLSSPPEPLMQPSQQSADLALCGAGEWHGATTPGMLQAMGSFRLRKPSSESDIEGWASKHLNTHTQGIFRRKLSIVNLLSWSGEAIRKPLIVTADRTIMKEACEVFRLVQMYMGDRRCRLERAAVALEVARRGWSLQGLRDELFVQLCKQTTENLRPESLTRGWELLAICLAFFPPSPKFHTYLEGYIYRHLDPAHDQKGIPISTYAQYCYRKLQKVAVTGGKKGLKKPNLEEVQQARNAIFTPSLFGSLEEIMALQRQRFPEQRLPWVQSGLSLKVLELQGTQTEGIFRVPGDIDEVNALKLKVDQWTIPSDLTDPHVPASLLKLWYRELEEPLIPRQFYERCIVSYDNAAAAVGVVHALPDIN
uniref:Rho GTPase activating protein 39 n=1 Tax=Petromyzon marinus TaxID=7757 RepID=S4RIL2_PETMA